MHTFILLTRLSPEALKSPASMEDIEKPAVRNVEKECPDVKWLQSHALLGPYDYLDIFRAPDTYAPLKMSAIVRTFGRAYSEVWNATDWNNFKTILHSLPTQ